MQNQNRNSPSLYEKLKFPEFQRNSLDKQRKFWKKIINKNEVRCIFSNKILTVNNFDIDHFICWNFLAHDQEWNLIPVLSEINRSKNNKIPSIQLVKNFINFKISSFKYAQKLLSDKKYKEYLAEHSNFINFNSNDCFTENYKIKYSEEIKLLINKAKNQGFEKYDAGNYQGAIDDWSKAIEINPQNAINYNNRGSAKDDLGDHQGAIADYSKQ